MLTQSQVREFRENGFVVLKSFYDLNHDLEPILWHIYQLIGALIEREKLAIERPTFSIEHFDCGFLELVRHDRDLGGVVYDAVKQIPGFVRLLSSLKHERLYRDLFCSELPGIVQGGQGIRIDIPFEQRFLSPWHQEYLSHLRSEVGVACWAPLTPITPEMGPVEICAGSHKENVFPVRFDDLDNPEKRDPYSMRIDREAEIVSRFSRVAPCLELGDLLLTDWLVLHRSGSNVSGRCRWSMQIRYFSFDNKPAIDRNWAGSFASGVDVKSIHPELVLN